MIKFCIEVGVPDVITMQILVTIGSGVSDGAGVEFPTFPLTCVVVLKTLWHYRAACDIPMSARSNFIFHLFVHFFTSSASNIRVSVLTSTSFGIVRQTQSTKPNVAVKPDCDTG